jgi:hypothetical protein
MIAAALLLAAAPAVASSGVTSFGRDVVISQPVAGRVVAVLSDVRIAAPVSGDVIVWGGDVSFGPSGEVRSNLSVFGGDVARASGRLPVRGTVSTPGTLLRFYLDEMQRAPWQTGERPATLTGLRLIVLAVWLAWGFFFSTSAPVRARGGAGARQLDGDAAGVLGVLALFVTAAPRWPSFPRRSRARRPPRRPARGGGEVGMAAQLLLGQKIMRSSPARALRIWRSGSCFSAPSLWFRSSEESSERRVGRGRRHRLTSRFGTPNIAFVRRSSPRPV